MLIATGGLNVNIPVENSPAWPHSQFFHCRLPGAQELWGSEEFARMNVSIAHPSVSRRFCQIIFYTNSFCLKNKLVRLHQQWKIYFTVVASQTNVIRGLGCLILRVTAVVISNIENQIRHCSQHRPACQTFVVVEIWRSVRGQDKIIYTFFGLLQIQLVHLLSILTKWTNQNQSQPRHVSRKESVCLFNYWLSSSHGDMTYESPPLTQHWQDLVRVNSLGWAIDCYKM